MLFLNDVVSMYECISLTDLLSVSHFTTVHQVGDGCPVQNSRQRVATPSGSYRFLFQFGEKTFSSLRGERFEELTFSERSAIRE